jgi:uncharacterized protein (DUF4415 family)
MKRKLSAKGRRRAAVKSAVARKGSTESLEIPPLDDDFWAKAVRNPYFRPLKQSTTVRIDADVLAWLRAQGKGYQTRINRILRAAMLHGAKKGQGSVARRR